MSDFTDNLNLELFATGSSGSYSAAQVKTLLNSNFQTLDSFRRTGGTDGLKLDQNSFDIDGDVNFGGGRAINLKSVAFGPQTAVTGTNQLFFKSSGDCFIRDGNGVEIQISSLGLLNTGSTAIQSIVVRETATDETISSSDSTQFLAFDTSSPRAVTLPAAASAGQGRFLYLFDQQADPQGTNITVSPAGSDTVNGSTGSFLMNEWSLFFRNTDGDGWHAINTSNLLSLINANSSSIEDIRSEIPLLQAYTASAEIKFSNLSTFNNAVSAQTASLAASITSNASTISAVSNLAMANSASIASLSGGGGGGVAGTILATHFITSSGGGSITLNSGTVMVHAHVVGAGGGGGGSQGASNEASAGGGGGGGAWVFVQMNVGSETSASYSVGSGGSGGTGASDDGAAGSESILYIGATSFTADGGNGGQGAKSETNDYIEFPGTGGFPTLNDQVRLSSAGHRGEPGHVSLSGASSYDARAVGGSGGASGRGHGGGSGGLTSNGVDGTHGGGGGGASSQDSSTTPRSGGDGGDGYIELTELGYHAV